MVSSRSPGPLRWAVPPAPPSLRGRSAELGTLARLVREAHPTVVALIGAGGSGKTTLAAALGRRLARAFEGRIAWVRIGAWDPATIVQMMALQLGLPSRHPARELRRELERAGRALVVLDNHESDAATARVLEGLRGAPVTWILTARRCLLGGVTTFPVIAPLVARRGHPFRAVASLTRLLRWNAVALDLADALVAAGHADPASLARRLEARGVGRIEVVEHEDDVPEVRAVVLEALRHVRAPARRCLAVLAGMGGDHLDPRGVAALAGVRDASAPIEGLRALRLVQEPRPGRFTLHATVRHALRRELPADADALAAATLGWLEGDPARVSADPTHLFALMDWAQERRHLATILRVSALAERLEG